MGGKMKLLPSLCKVPLCTQKPQTSSFRLSTATKDDILKTINSVYIDQQSDMVETPDSWFSNSPEAGNLSASDDYDDGRSSSDLEAIIRGAQQSSSSDHPRLLFNPTAYNDSPKLGPNTISHSNVRSLTPINNTPFKQGVSMCMDSDDPYEDFKRSMEEMVGSISSVEVREDYWGGLEELLAWYLKVNGRKHHGFIITAFIDLIAGLFGNYDESYNVEDEVVVVARSSTSFSSAAASSLSSSPSSSDFHMICC